VKIIVSVCIALLISSQAVAGDQSKHDVVKIGNGITQVDFTGEGVQDFVVSGHRENYNAHSFDVVSFYVPVQDDAGTSKQWNIVPVMTKGSEKEQVDVSGGADCVLHDFRLLAGHGKEAATLILADRDLGESFASAAKVTFTYYSLVRNPDGSPGSPTYAFEQSRVVNAKHAYCDIEEAFDRELGLGAR
jgi:hypothetical protein